MIKFKNRPACEGTDTEMWFPNRSEYPNKTLLTRICKGCPAKRECLEYSLHNEVEGWWAGTTGYERKRMRKEQGIIPKPVLPLDLIRA